MLSSNPHHVGTTLIAPAPPAAASTYVNPAQMSYDPHPGPSSQPLSRKKSASSAASSKRKRTDNNGDDSDTETPTSQQHKKNRDGPKKKKATRACAHCQKAHLTCDDSRPCQRCIKRGLADNCVEGHRKKAKYLLDDNELDQLKGPKSKSHAPSSRPEKPAQPVRASSTHNGTPQAPPPPQPDPFFVPNDPMFNVSFDPNYSFGSEAANLEYSILSAILGNPSPPESSPPQQPYSSTLPSSSNPEWPNDPQQPSQVDPYNEYSNYTSQSLPESDPNQPTDSAFATEPTFYNPTYPQALPNTDQSYVALPQDERSSALRPQYRARSPSQTVPTQTSTTHAPNSPASESSGAARSVVQTINDCVTVPHDYTEGYHFLMKHLPNRFEKNDILRIVRALAIFRPSLIALQMPLSEDDEVFVEKCFQRSLLELDKLISFSGTPTVVWRRTGEICLVAPEFCTLTEWSMDDLVVRRKYIWELFENQSVVEYWENFAEHAFENTTKSVYSHCVLLKPSGAPVPSTFCFSIKRDIFDLPSLVIGQWLPLL